MRTLWAGLWLLAAVSAPAGIERIAGGGVAVDLADLLPEDEPAVLVLHTPWDQDSITLLGDIESWADQYPDLAIFFVDCVDPRTQVYRQFSLQRIPAILIFDRNREQIGGILHGIDELESALKQHQLP